MALRHTIRDLALSVSPRITSQLLAWRSQRLIMKIEKELGLVKATKCFVDKYGDKILDGPFKGMRYPKSTHSKRNVIPKLLGTYESELHPWIEILLSNEYEQILNVGSADGYYTVGCAIAFPDAIVIGFDTDPWARAATKNLAIANNASNYLIDTMCTPSWLKKNLRPNGLIIVDCEGYEEILLDPVCAPTLRESDILVELHEHAVPGVSDTIRKRFQSTHEIQSTEWKKKSGSSYSQLEYFSKELADAVVSEGRVYPQSWLLLLRQRTE